MAEDTTTSATVTEESVTEESATDSLGDAGKKALDAVRREKRAAEKRAADLETQLQAFEDRDKTELQRLTERADAAEKAALAHQASALRLEIAAEKGLTPAQAKRLVGESREDLEADADDLLENFKPAPTDETATEAVARDLDLGQRGTTAASGDPAADFAKFMKRATAS